MTVMNRALTPGRRRSSRRVVFSQGFEVRTGVYVLVALTAGAYLPSPLYPSFQAVFGASDLAITVLYATFALVSAPALLLLGPASDVFGPRSMLRFSIVLAAMGSTCFAFAPDTMWLVIGRAAQGLALGAATAAATTLISSGRPAVRQLPAAVIASTAFVAGTALGPVLAGLLAENGPWPRTLPFILHIVALAVGWRGVRALPTRPRVSLRQWRPTVPHVPLGIRGLFVSAALTGFLAWTVAGLFLSVIPTLLTRADQHNVAATGAVLGAVLACSALTQPLVPRWGTSNAQTIGLIALVVSLIMLPVVTGLSMGLTLLAAVIAGFGHGLAYGGAAATITDTVPAERRGAVTGALYLAFYLGSGFPAVAIGLITLTFPLAVATTWVTIGAGALVPLALWTVRRQSPAVVSPDRFPAAIR